MNMEISVRAVDAAPERLPPQLRSTVAYWEECRGERFAPRWRDFALDEISPEILPWSTVVDVRDDPLDFVYRFWGTSRLRLQEGDMTGRSARDLTPAKLSDLVFDEYADLLERRRPTLYSTRISGPMGELDHAFLRLPLSDDGTTIEKVFGVSHNREGKSMLLQALGGGS